MTATLAILAGGRGTRLGPLLCDLPKPMLPVAGRPFLEYLVEWAGRFGIDDIVLCVGFRAEKIRAHFGNGGGRIRYSAEREPLGTAGALRLALPLVRTDPFLAMNGDSFCPVELDALLRKHRDRRAAATLAVVETEDRSRFGSVEVGTGGDVLGFREKGAGAGRGWINGGVYALGKNVLERVAEGSSASIERDVFPGLVGRGLCAFGTPGPLVDIGTPESLEAAHGVVPGLLRRRSGP
ncbi:MAG: nucleotidyltransferase family protein [Planctomycetes bacterium]|nr:nucleotidyltransferase family protein [Planctomycetota bacterium]